MKPKKWSTCPTSSVLSARVLLRLCLIFLSFGILAPVSAQQKESSKAKRARLAAEKRLAQHLLDSIRADTIKPYAPVGFRSGPLDLLDVVLTPKDSQDHNYVQTYERVFTPRIFYGGKIVTFGFSPSRNYTDNLQYYPNVRSSIGVGAFYGIYGLSFSFSFNNNGDDRVEKYGKTEYFDGAFNSYQIRYGYDLFYQSYRGFFVASPQNLVSPTIPSGGPYPQRPDILLRNMGGNFYHIYNWNKFSMQAAFPQVKRQLKSAGSLLHMISAYYTSISGDSSINSSTARGFTDKPSTLTGAVNADSTFKFGRFLTLNLLPGYGHTFVYKRLFVTGVLFIGPGAQLQYTLQDQKRQFFLSPFVRTNFRASLGYNDDRFFASVQVMYDRSRNYFEGIRLQNTNNNYSIQAGYRF